MTTAISGMSLLTEALQLANNMLPKRDGITVVDPMTLEHLEVSGKLSEKGPKSPVHLKFFRNELKPVKIGWIHLVRLEGENWDQKPFEELAKTVREVADAILERIALFQNCQAKSGRYFIDKKNGTIFERNPSIVMHDDHFKIEGQLASSPDGQAIVPSKLKSEGIIRFVKLDSGETEIVDGIDKRVGKRILFGQDGVVYRA